MGAQLQARETIKKRRPDEKQPRHLLVTLAVVLLPFTYVPHEIIRSGPNISWLSLDLALIVAVR